MPTASWDALKSKYETRRINHQEAYSDGEACTNMAEEYFSRLRRQSSAIITMSLEHICSDTPKDLHGERIIAALRMVNKHIA